MRSSPSTIRAPAGRSRCSSTASTRTTVKPSAKNLLLGLATLAGCLGLAELGVRGFDGFAEERAATRRYQPLPSEDAAPKSRFLLHPFLAYAGNPKFGRGMISEQGLRRTFPGAPSEYYLRNSHINHHGFPSEHPDYLGDAEGFHVGIFGGSAAEQLATVGGHALIAATEASKPELRGRVRVFNAAIGGYKQPQQLIALILLSLQGVRFDVVVNLDGFNEVALSGADAGMDYNPLFPSRRHYLLMMNLDRDADSIERYAEVIGTRRRIEEWRDAADRWLSGGSELVRAAVGSLVLRLEARADRLEQGLQQQAAPPPGLAAWQPECLRRSQKCWDLVADIWQSSSLEMAAVAEQIGARYLHVLQPNQYDEGSKPLSPREREIAYQPDGEWPAGVRRGYPLLRERIPGMRERGVEVLDLSRLFAGVSEDLYSDPCCHYNLRGNDRLARAVAGAILAPEEPSVRRAAAGPDAPVSLPAPAR